MQALEVNDLKLAYNKGQLVLDGVSFSVEPAEIIAAVGMSGSGKTTLLRAIAGFEKASSGEVFIHGVKVSGNGLHQKPEKRKVGFVFQDLALFGHMTVEQNVAFGISNKEEKNTLCSQLLQLVGLEGFEKRYPSQLSGGQQQRVAIARALATRPELLLMDEPFSSLDKGLRAQVRDEITDILKKSGTAAIIVTHDIEDAYAMANRILVLDGGKVVQFDTPEKTYRCPASEQVAKLGGKTNLVDASLISGELTGKVLIRPEHIQLAEQGDWKVATAVFHGQFHEYELRNGAQTLLVHSKELLETGTTTGISVDQKYIHPLS